MDKFCFEISDFWNLLVDICVVWVEFFFLNNWIKNLKVGCSICFVVCDLLLVGVVVGEVCVN